MWDPVSLIYFSILSLFPLCLLTCVVLWGVRRELLQEEETCGIFPSHLCWSKGRDVCRHHSHLLVLLLSDGIFLLEQMIFANLSNSRIKFLLCCFLNSYFLNNPFLLQVQGVIGLQGIHCLQKCVSVCAGGVQLVWLLGSKTVKNGHNKSHWSLGESNTVSFASVWYCIVSLYHSIKNNNLDLIGLDLIHAFREGKVLP